MTGTRTLPNSRGVGARPSERGLIRRGLPERIFRIGKLDQSPFGSAPLIGGPLDRGLANQGVLAIAGPRSGSNPKIPMMKRRFEARAFNGRHRYRQPGTISGRRGSIPIAVGFTAAVPGQRPPAAHFPEASPGGPHSAPVRSWYRSRTRCFEMSNRSATAEPAPHSVEPRSRRQKPQGQAGAGALGLRTIPGSETSHHQKRLHRPSLLLNLVA